MSKLERIIHDNSNGLDYIWNNWSGTGRRESVMFCNGIWGQMLRILSMRL